MIEEGKKLQLAKVNAYMEMVNLLFYAKAIGPYLPLSTEVQDVLKILNDPDRQLSLMVAKNLSQLIVI